VSGAHAFLPPSGAAYWVECVAWPAMNQRYPQDDTPESMEGTAAHDVFAAQLAGRPLALGALTANGVPVTREMIDGADLFVATIDADLDKLPEGYRRELLRVESPIGIGRIHEQNWGTPDAWHYSPQIHVLRIYDYKFGHDFVDAFQNWQLADYAAGIIDMLRTWYHERPDFVETLLVTFVIVQPRNYDVSGPVRRWQVKLDELMPMWERLRVAAPAALVPTPIATPGPVQCEHCPGRHACTPLQRAGMRAVSYAKRSVPHDLGGAALGGELALLQDAAKLLEARRTGLEAEAEARIKQGQLVSGYGLAPTEGRETWIKSPEEVIAMGALMGVNLAKTTAITPNQARAAGMHPDLVKAFAIKPTNGMKLVRDDGSAAAKAFGKVD
jgi:hypothetical protein